MNDFMNMVQDLANASILVTGATGMIGQKIICDLLEMNDRGANNTIIAHARSKEKAERVFAQQYMRKDFKVVLCDITELTLMDSVDYIVHTAGVTGDSKKHIEYPMRTILTAVAGTKKVLDIAKEKESKGVVFLSTLEVYGDTRLDRAIKEDDGGYIDPLNVRSSYSESKRLCECMCAAYAKQYGVPAVIGRLTATFGPGVSYSDNRVFAQFARCIIEKKDIVLKSKGETVRNYCDVSDASKAILLLLVKGNPGEAYNIANADTAISIKDMAEKFISFFPDSSVKLKFDLKEDATKFGYRSTIKTVLCPNKLMKLGWQPNYSLNDMIVRLVESMRKEFENEKI